MKRLAYDVEEDLLLVFYEIGYPVQTSIPFHFRMSFIVVVRIIVKKLYLK
jgi:hypothetical protein